MDQETNKLKLMNLLLTATNEIVEPVFRNDTIVFGLLFGALALIFYTSSKKTKFWNIFYKILPPLLLCYLIPSILTSFNIISKDYSGLYTMAKNFLLPASLVLMTLSIDLKALTKLGPKALIMFFTGTLGIIIGGPIAILIVSTFSPETVGGIGPDAVWRGLSTLAGSWIGGGANQAAMLEIFKYNQEKYGAMVLVDIVVANLWMATLLIGITKTKKIDKWLKADTSSIDELKDRVENYQNSIAKVPTLKDYMIIGGIAFLSVSIGHLFAGYLSTYFKASETFSQTTLASSFFWLIVIVTTIGLVLSNTKARELEGVGASKIGGVFIYILVATIGMKMDITKMLNHLDLLLVGVIWMMIHAILLIVVAKIIKAPFFFLAVGSKANVGGAASAPIIAAAFHPSLASVGVLLAVLGYAVGTYGALLCAYLMEVAS